MSDIDLIGIEEIAQMIHMSVLHTRNRIVKRNDFPRAYKIGRRYLYDRAEVIEWIECQKILIDGRRTPKLRHQDQKAA